MPELPSIENEIAANALRARRNELEQALNETPPGERATEMCGELAEIYTALDRMYLPADMAADGYETPYQTRALVGI